jgi:hypothetical protein
MAVSYRWATRSAQTAVVLTLVAGAVFLTLDAFRSSQSPTQSSDLVATTKSMTEKKNNPKGTESTERREVTTSPNPNLTDRILGATGLWVARMLLVILAAFLAGALVQRVLLGKFAFKAGGLELPEVQAPPLAILPPSVSEAFQLSLPIRLDSLEELSITESPTYSLMKAVGEKGPADCVVIDLEEGVSWLTTRLFILAILLQRMRSVRSLVFLEERAGVSKRYLGVRPPEEVRWLLARAYPWMEQALAKSYYELPRLEITSASGALPPDVAAMLMERFVLDSTISGPIQGDDPENWVQLIPGRWEHARWVNGALATDLFNLSPSTTSFVGLSEERKAENTFAELGGEGPFVALLDERHRFLALLDRESLLEKLAAEARLKFAAVLAYEKAQTDERPAEAVQSGTR